MRGTKARYTGDADEMDGIDDSSLPYFLPLRDGFLRGGQTIKHMLRRSRRGVDLCNRQGLPYEHIIRASVD